MDSDGPSGFRNAPVTKFLVSIVGSCSALAAVYNMKPQLTTHGQFWRLFTSHWTFSSIGTTVVGTWLLYKMKVVERRYGSSKYAALVFISFVASTLLQTGVLVIGSQFGLIKNISSGPYAILFSIIYQFQKIVPPSHQVNMLGTTITDKTYVCFAATQLILSNSTFSIVPCLCGLFVGAIYDGTNLKQWRFPKWARTLTWKYILPVLATDSKKKRKTPVAADVNSSSIGGMRQRHTAPPISEGDINTMFSMFPNYSRQDIKNALVTSKSDLNRAAEILLTTEPSASGSSQ